MVIEVNSEHAMKEFGERLGKLLIGGEVIELVGDVGSGKTTFVKGLARGLGVDDDVQSPSFTISRIYSARGGLKLAHYDFYRLNDPGILASELHETVSDDNIVTAIEWGGVVEGVLPTDRLSIELTTTSEDKRELKITGNNRLLENL